MPLCLEGAEEEGEEVREQEPEPPCPQRSVEGARDLDALRLVSFPGLSFAVIVAVVCVDGVR